MSAQQQLAHMIRHGVEYGPQNDGTDAVEFIRDHGHAIAELIEVEHTLMTRDRITNDEFVSLCDRRKAAIRKLTQDERP